MSALDTQFHQLHQQGLLILTNVAEFFYGAMGSLVKSVLANGQLDNRP